MTRKKKDDGLVSKILKFYPFKDEDGKFISYCSYGPHQGLVKRPYVCEARNCKYYHKFYIYTKPKDL